MQQHDKMRRVSQQRNGSRNLSAVAPARTSCKMRLSFALLLAAACPIGLYAASEQAAAGGAAKAPAVGLIHPDATSPGFTFAADSIAVEVLSGGRAEPVEISTSAQGGFKGLVTVKTTNVPAGFTVSPATFTVAAGSEASIGLSAARSVRAGTYTIELAGSSGTITRDMSVKVEVTPASATTTVSLNTLFFDFGNNLVGVALTQTAVLVTNTGSSTLFLAPALSDTTSSYSIVAGKSCGATLAARKSCDIVIRYMPKKASPAQNAVLNLNYGNADPGNPGTVAITGVSAQLQPGVVTPTNNPQVALYTMTLPFPGRVKVDFGETKSYGLKTWYQSTDTNNGQVSILVAGMKGNTTYHMMASLILGDNLYVSDPAGDQTFKTGEIPNPGIEGVDYQYHVTATTAPGMTPQPGIELTNPLNSLTAFDLQGNQIWTYIVPTPKFDTLDGFKALPNGDFMIVVSTPVGAGGPIDEIDEIDLAGDVVHRITIADLNAALQYAPSSCTECPGLNLNTFHHDVTPLPNGHILVLTNMVKNLPPSATGEPKATDVTGDVVIDLDENWNPVWAWSEFNHLSTLRHPMSWPDWTHSNAVVYSPDDGDFLISIRHQNWVLKVNYQNGSGDGSIVWTLGYQGSLKLIGGNSPQDWQYAQHDPGFFSPNTSGVFSLGLMDNGDDRLYPASANCPRNAQGVIPPNCEYSSIPVFQIDEEKKTATLTFHQILPHTPANLAGGTIKDLYSYFGGNTDELPNGDVEYDLCGLEIAPATPGGAAGAASMVREVTQEKNPRTVWTLELQNENFYRAFRAPSLYPGVQW
jgi:arylsulfate sulfotransferase